jgi:hypothetical protein
LSTPHNKRDRITTLANIISRAKYNTKKKKTKKSKQTKAKLSTYNVFGHIKQLFKRERSKPYASHEQKGCESYDKEVLCAQQIFQQAAHTGHTIQWDLA